MAQPQYTYRNVQLVHIVDGDTADFRIDLGFRMTCVQRFRLWGIDTPEPGQQGGAEAESYLRDKLEGRDADTAIRSYKDPDSFGRWLGIIYLDGLNLNQQMVKDGYAVEYQL